MNRILKKAVSAMLIFTVLQAFAEEVSYTLNPTLNPKNLSEVERGSKVTLDFGDIQINPLHDVAVTALPQYDEENGEAETLYLNTDEEGVAYFNFDVTAEAGTQYKLTIARGQITSVDGTLANMAKSWYYFVIDAEEEEETGLTLISVEPASGSTITAGTTVNLFFSEEVDIATCTDAVTITNNATGTETKVTLDWNWNTFDFSNLQFTMPKGLAEGEYTATIAEGLISGYETGDENSAITLSYTVIAEGAEPSEPTPVEVKNFSPASDEVETLSNVITIGFKNQISALSEEAYAELKDDATGKTYVGTMTIPEYMEKTVKVNFDYGEDGDADKYLCVPGTYTLTIAANSIIGKDGGVNAEITHDWAVKGVIDINDIEYASVLPRVNNTLTSLGTVMITFSQEPTLTKKSDAKAYVGEKPYDFTLEDNRLTIEVNPEITANGIYVVTVPAGSVYSIETGHGNKAIALTYTVGSTSALEWQLGNESIAVVYNLQGMPVLRNATSEDVRSLPKGIYIFNGKKVEIR